ncbi:threonine aldolase family protein [Thermasporomyces composti]|uniref:L-threonine aldolase n=1 Tax=Thermasporomyces composti TaxID=696763 RepID=A0A3D9V9L1_THECX|nr:GntG family PLP-dependent aldolase [Thermasporomyces composti]REF34844.1 L-threonine aldolase [Thermasporomyces composti]
MSRQPDHLVDLRSDTVTKPTEGMRRAMAQAEVGDDVYGEDPTCRALEDRVAELLGKEAALFTVSGSLANLLAVHTVVQPGQEVLCEARAHIARAELGGHAAVFGVTTRTWSHPRGLVDLDAIEAMLAPDAGPHFVSTAAVSVENTHNLGGGSVQPVPTLRALRTMATQAGVAIHLDGARLWNASVATGVPVHVYAELADVVTVCLSKGLGAPVGSLVAGSARHIAEARVWRKRLGAGWRQAGVLAAAGLYALDHHIERLAEDHAHAQALARTLAERLDGVAAVSDAETNIVVIDLPSSGPAAPKVAERARAEGVLVSVLGPSTLRLVTHLDVGADDCAWAGDVLARAIREG